MTITPEQMKEKPISEQLTESLMEAADLFGGDPMSRADPRAWPHILTYAPTEFLIRTLKKRTS